MYIKNNCWKDIKSGWIIMADMDEYLCVTEPELLEEMNRGTSVLSVRGIDMIGESLRVDLSDIDLQNINKYRECPSESKNICFLRDKVKEMNYALGAHTCDPKGKIKFSDKKYLNKHMNFLGLAYYTNKSKSRHARSIQMRQRGLATHYTENQEDAKSLYLSGLNNSHILN